MMRLAFFYSLLIGPTLSASPSFTRDVSPLLRKSCAGCHQPSSKASGLDVTSYAAFLAGGKRGASFIAEKPGESLTIKYLTAEVQPRMPMGQPPLPGADIDIIREWIQAGAKDDTPLSIEDTTPTVYSQAPVINSLRFSPDGRSIAVSGNREVFIHPVEAGAAPMRLQGKAERLLSLAYSADGKLLIAGGGTPAQFGEVQIWDVHAGKLLRSAMLTNDTVFGASLSPDASKIAVGATDNTVHVLETATAKELYKIGNHEDWVLATVFGVDSKRFVSVSRDRAAKIIDASSGAFLENANLLKSELNAIARHPSKDIVVIGGEDRYPYVYLLDRPRNMKIADDTTLVRRIERQDGPITALDWSANAKLIAVAGAASSVNIYDADTGDRKLSCSGHAAGLYAIAFSPDSTRLATGGFDGKVRIYSMKDCSLLREFVPVPLTNSQTNSVAAGTR